MMRGTGQLKQVALAMGSLQFILPHGVPGVVLSLAASLLGVAVTHAFWNRFSKYRLEQGDNKPAPAPGNRKKRLDAARMTLERNIEQIQQEISNLNFDIR